MTIMMLWKLVAAIIFVTLIVSPAWVFKKIELILFNEEYDEMVVSVIADPSAIYSTVDNEIEMKNDEERLEAINRAYENATSPEMKRIWMIKRSELLRSIKWRTLVAATKTNIQ